MPVYASGPAPPILAHALISQPSQSTQTETNPGIRGLENAIEEGIRSCPDAFFCSGIVIAFSGLRQDDRHRGHDREFVGQIPRSLLTNHILKVPPGQSTNPSIFIIHPFHYTIFSPQNLLTSLLSLKTTLSREEAISLLDTVQLLPVFDFPAAVQAISQVSGDLQRRYHDDDEQRRDHPVVVLVVAGLDTLVEGVIRASNPIKGAAVLDAALRELTQLSRVNAAFLSVMLVNTGGLGGAGPGPGPGPGLGNRGERSLSSLLPSLLQKTLDQGVDRHLLVSKVEGRSSRRVMEVIKDRVGSGSGMKCVLDR